MNEPLRRKAAALFRGKIARNTLYVTFWQGVRVSLQAAWAVTIARSIGPQGYGTFAGVAGLASALGALSGLGFGLLMLQDATRDPTRFGEAWKRALWLTLLSGVMLTLIFTAAAPAVSGAHIAWATFLAIGIPELICFPLVIVCSYAFQTHERMGWAGAIYAMVPAGNILAVLCFVATTTAPTLEGYVKFHSAVAVVTASMMVWLVKLQLAPRAARFVLGKRDIVEGAGFSTMRLIDISMSSLDKTLVLRLAGSEIAGIYTSAFRLVSVLALPVTSMAMAALPKLFRGDNDGHGRFIRTLLISAIGYGIAAALAMLALAGLLPILFGSPFARAATVARWMALVPMFYGMSSLGCNVLITIHRRRLRILAQSVGLVLLISFALWLVPRYGLAGAALMMNFTLAILATLIWFLIWRSRRATASHAMALEGKKSEPDRSFNRQPTYKAEVH